MGCQCDKEALFQEELVSNVNGDKNKTEDISKDNKTKDYFRSGSQYRQTFDIEDYDIEDSDNTNNKKEKNFKLDLSNNPSPHQNNQNNRYESTDNNQCKLRAKKSKKDDEYVHTNEDDDENKLHSQDSIKITEEINKFYQDDIQNNETNENNEKDISQEKDNNEEINNNNNNDNFGEDLLNKNNIQGKNEIDNDKNKEGNFLNLNLHEIKEDEEEEEQFPNTYQNKEDNKVEEYILQNINNNSNQVENYNNITNNTKQLDDDIDAKLHIVDQGANNNIYKSSFSLSSPLSNPDFYDEFSGVFFNLLNKIRTNPIEYISFIEENKQYITRQYSSNENKERLLYINKVKVALTQGEEAFNRAIKSLESRRPCNPLIYDRKLSVTPPPDEENGTSKEYFQRQIEELRQNGRRVDYYFTDRVKIPEISLLLLIIDDIGIKEGKKGNKLLNPNITSIGISSAYYNKKHFVAYFAFSKIYQEIE